MAPIATARDAQLPTPREAGRHASLEHGSGTLADLVADARAIPRAAFGVPKKAAVRVIDLIEPARDCVIHIPDAAVDLMHRAEQTFADYLR